MKKLRRTLSWLAVAAIFALPLMSLPGAVDMFLKIEPDVQGESQDQEHKDEIDVLSWSWGVSNSGTTHVGAGGGSGAPNFQDISVTKWIDKSSPVLMLYCANGKHLDKATLTVRQASDKTSIDSIVIEMENVLITSVSTGGSAGQERLSENVTLNFAKFSFKYTPKRGDGTADKTVESGWDIPNNKGY